MKLEAIRQRLSNAALGTVIGPFDIDLDLIRQDPTFQVRRKLDEANLSRLKAAYRSGKAMLPITLAILDEAPEQLPVIVDGHHRVTVLETLAAEAQLRGSAGTTTVQAMLIRVRADEARWQAASANSAHGTPLKGPEVRAMFRRYVEAGHHRLPDGGFKSYREIGRDIGRSHPTIMKWMQSDFPKEAVKMGNQEEPVRVGGEGAPVPITLYKHQARAALSDFLGAHGKVGYHEGQEMIDWLWSALEDMERVQARRDPFSRDDEGVPLGPGEAF